MAEAAAVLTYEDIYEVLVSTDAGRKQCTVCAYMNLREREELDAWEEKNADVIDRWLRYRQCHLFRTVSVGGCGHAFLPWQEEARRCL